MSHGSSGMIEEAMPTTSALMTTSRIIATPKVIGCPLARTTRVPAAMRPIVLPFVFHIITGA